MLRLEADALHDRLLRPLARNAVFLGQCHHVFSGKVGVSFLPDTSVLRPRRFFLGGVEPATQPAEHFFPVVGPSRRGGVAAGC